MRVLMAVLSTLMRLLRNHRITMGSVHHYGITSHVDHILHYTLLHTSSTASHVAYYALHSSIKPAASS